MPVIRNARRFQHLIDDAVGHEFSGWDFSYLNGRWSPLKLPWDYAAVVRERMKRATSMLDMGTGDGEYLATLAPLPERTRATEGWPPNVAIARRRLKPLGVTVHEIEDKNRLPFAGGTFDLIINRHEHINPADVYRVLKPGGAFITQQVGGSNNIALTTLLTGSKPNWRRSLTDERRRCEEAGFHIAAGMEAFPELRFHDIGAVVFYLKAIKRQVKDFSVEKYRTQLGRIHNVIERDGFLAVASHRIFIHAEKSRNRPATQ